MDPVDLRTDRLLLRPWAPGDEQVLVEGCNDDLITRWTRTPAGYTHEMAVARITDVQAGFVQEGVLRGRHAPRDGVHDDTWVASLVPSDLAQAG